MVGFLAQIIMKGVIFKKVCKSFGSLSVLNSLSISVEPGEFFVVLGPSGEGKTTILNIAAGIIRLNSGIVEIDGEIVDNSTDSYVPPETRGIGYVFQNYALYPHMNVYKNIAFPLKMKKLQKDEIDSRVRRVAGMFEIDHLLERRPAQLSGGQQQRVAIARAIVKEPEVLLMDEPFSNLEPNLRNTVRTEIRRLIKKLGITTIMATHDTEEAMSLADRVAILRKGRLEQVGIPSRIYEQPRSLFVANFLGGINTLKVAVENGNIKLGKLNLKLESNNGNGNGVDKQVLLGFRPEHVVLGNGPLMGKVVDSEYMGGVWTTFIDTEAGQIKAISSSEPDIGENIRFEVSSFHVYTENGEFMNHFCSTS